MQNNISVTLKILLQVWEVRFHKKECLILVVQVLEIMASYFGLEVSYTIVQLQHSTREQLQVYTVE